MLVCMVSIGYEWCSLRLGVNVIDEGMPLYAAMQLHEGATLYRDVFFVFPPGHVLIAWLAFAIDPPGLLLSRILYSVFTVGLCAALYLVGRRLMPAGFAVLGCLMVAILSSTSHLQHHLFGYRYLVFSALALLCFARHLRADHSRWIGAAGILTGIALCFRLTPAFAVACGIGAGLLAAAQQSRVLARDLVWYGVGTLVVVAPVVAGLSLGSGVELETLWSEIVVRPMEMTARQSLPIPKLDLAYFKLFQLFPEGTWEIWRLVSSSLFGALLFRILPVFYLAYLAVLIASWVRCRRSGRRFGHALLVATVVWGGVYLMRAYGRADEAHLASALPPSCLLLAHLASLMFGALLSRVLDAERTRRWVAAIGGALILATWACLQSSDRVLWSPYRTPSEVLDGEILVRGKTSIDSQVRRIWVWTRPDDRILILGPQCLLYVLSGRRGPGFADVIMPGTFRDTAEERAFVETLMQEPPTLVLRSLWGFDWKKERSVDATAPQVVAWVDANFGPPETHAGFRFYRPRVSRDRR